MEKDKTIDRQVEFLFNTIYAGFSREFLAEEYKPFEITDRREMQYHIMARFVAGKPSVKLAKGLREFKGGFCDDSFGNGFLRGFVKKCKSLSEEELRNYAVKKDVQAFIAYPDILLSRHVDLDFSYGFGNDAFYDAKFAVCMTYKSVLAAYVGFNPDDKKIIVKQIQGVKQGKKEKQLLNSIKWERALLSYLIVWAEENGVPEIEVVSVANNRWARITFDYLKEHEIYQSNITLEQAARMSDEEEKAIKELSRKSPEVFQTQIHLMPHRGFMRYDVTAQRCGFTKNADGNYIRKIK